MPAEGGPWVQMALFCEKVIVDKQDVLTIVRVVDRVTRSSVGQNAPTEMKPFDHQLWLVLGLKPGDARGRYPVRIDTEGPDGITRPGPVLTVNLESEDRGHNLVLNFQFHFEREGLYWFNVLLDERLLTRIPLRVLYQQTSA